MSQIPHIFGFLRGEARSVRKEVVVDHVRCCQAPSRLRGCSVPNRCFVRKGVCEGGTRSGAWDRDRLQPFAWRVGVDGEEARLSKQKPKWAFWRKESEPKETKQKAADQGGQGEFLEETVDLRPKPKEGVKRKWWRFWVKDEDRLLTGSFPAFRGDQETEPLEQQMTQKLPALPQGSRSAQTMPKAKKAFDSNQPFPTPPKAEPAVLSKVEATEDRAVVAQGAPVDPDGWFALALFLLMAAYSVPLWLAGWLPVEDAPLRMGGAAILRFSETGTWFTKIFGIEVLFYLNGATEGLLALLSAILPARVALLVLLQGYVVALPLALVSLMSRAGLSRWNALWGFFFLYHGAFLFGSLGAVLAMPILLWGMGGIYAWMARGEGSGGLVLFVASFLLIPLDLGMWLIFLVLALMSAFLLGESFFEGISHVVLVLISSVFLAPCVLGLLTAEAPLLGWDRASGWFTLASMSERLGFLQQQSFLLFPPPYGGVVVGALVLWLLGAVWGGLRRGQEGWRRRWFFPMLTVGYGVLLVLAPKEIRGVPLELHAGVAVFLLLLSTWMSFKPYGVGALLIALCVLLSLGGAVVVAEAFWRHGQEADAVASLAQRVPAKKRLLLWRVGSGSHLSVSYAAIGGLHMLENQGGANLPQRSMHWGPIYLRPKQSLPHPERSSLPSLQGWDYLLTRVPDPEVPAGIKLVLIEKKQRFRLYLLHRN